MAAPSAHLSSGVPGWRASVVDSLAGLGALAADWDQLLGAAVRPSPFLSWDWIDCWWRSFGAGAQLRVLVLRDAEGGLLGLAPLRIVRRWQGGAPLRSLEFLGYRGAAVCADHLDFLARPQLRDAVVPALVEAMLALPGWDVLVLDSVDEQSSLPRALQPHAAALRLAEVDGETCHYLPLPASVAELWRALGERHPQFAQNLLRYRRRLERRYRTRFVPDSAADALDPALAALAGLHGMSRARQGESNSFARADYYGFHRRLAPRLADQGRLYLARLECDGRIVAVLYGFVFAGVLYYYQSGFDTRLRADGVGKLLLARVLEDAVERLGVGEFDFLRGDEAYKRQWTEHARTTKLLRGWRAGVLPAFDRLGWRLRRQGSALLPRRPR
jgi:CelD/BcsL family acetyltransferase involved in cellulose biosynthesis